MQAGLDKALEISEKVHIKQEAARAQRDIERMIARMRRDLGVMEEVQREEEGVVKEGNAR
jgi:hypothetical protein